MRKFTKQQLDNWRTYEDVRQEGQFNMLSPQARELTGLSQEEYLFVLKNFSYLRDEALKQ